jgi:hypothetical protein
MCGQSAGCFIVKSGATYTASTSNHLVVKG